MPKSIFKPNLVVKSLKADRLVLISLAALAGLIGLTFNLPASLALLAGGGLAYLLTGSPVLPSLLVISLTYLLGSSLVNLTALALGLIVVSYLKTKPAAGDRINLALAITTGIILAELTLPNLRGANRANLNLALSSPLTVAAALLVGRLLGKLVRRNRQLAGLIFGILLAFPVIKYSLRGFDAFGAYLAVVASTVIAAGAAQLKAIIPKKTGRLMAPLGLFLIATTAVRFFGPFGLGLAAVAAAAVALTSSPTVLASLPTTLIGINLLLSLAFHLETAGRIFKIDLTQPAIFGYLILGGLLAQSFKMVIKPKLDGLNHAAVWVVIISFWFLEQLTGVWELGALWAGILLISVGLTTKPREDLLKLLTGTTVLLVGILVG